MKLLQKLNNFLYGKPIDSTYKHRPLLSIAGSCPNVGCGNTVTFNVVPDQPSETSKKLLDQFKNGEWYARAGDDNNWYSTKTGKPLNKSDND